MKENIKSYLQGLLIPQKAQSMDRISFWKEIILRSFLGIGVLAGTVLVVPVSMLQLNTGLWSLPAASVMLYLGALVLFLFNSIPYVIRAAGVVVLTILMGTVIMSGLWVFSGGPVWLFASSILASLLLGLRTAGLTVIVNTIILLTFYIYLDDLAVPRYSESRALLAFISFLFLNIVTTLASSILVSRLKQITRRETKLINDMMKEQNELFKTQAVLQKEIEIREKVEQYLRESEEKYRIMAARINDVIWSIDLEMNYTYLSPATTKIHGWTEEEFSGLGINDFLTPESVEKVLEAIGREFSEAERLNDFNRSVVLELEMYKKDGSIISTEVTASFVPGQDGRPTGVMGVTRDITERKRIEAERKSLEEKLERSKKMEALGLLAGGVAHDLNNVLSGIVSYPDLLLLDIGENDPLRESIEAIKDSGLKAAAIVQDLLSLARRNVANMEVCGLNALVTESLNSPEYRNLMESHPGAACSSNLWSSEVYFRGAPVHFKKMLMNLIVNAVESQPHGGTVTVSTKDCYLDTVLRGYDSVEPGEYAVLTVEDRGRGMSDEELDHIFEPFYTKKVMGRSGTGLGMTVVWGTVQDHGGYIDIKSIPGRGTAIDLYFPLSSEGAGDRPEKNDISEYCGNGEKILVVDDIPEQRKISRSILERLGYEVFDASSGERAVEIFDDIQPDLVILDMLMEPGMDGLDTCRELLKKRENIKVIIVSGFSETERVSEALRTGVCAYLKKPYCMENLGCAVHRELNNK